MVGDSEKAQRAHTTATFILNPIRSFYRSDCTDLRLKFGRSSAPTGTGTGTHRQRHRHTPAPTRDRPDRALWRVGCEAVIRTV